MIYKSGGGSQKQTNILNQTTGDHYKRRFTNEKI
jgi:hypothetical protein